MFSLLLACSSPQAPVPLEPTHVTESAPVVEQRYVHASKLNLRDEAGKKIGSLAINTPLTLQGEEGEKVQVLVANGTLGWVPKEFLGTAPITPDQALAEASTAPDLKTKISALQRAAALQPSVETLTALAEAYVDGGEPRKATVVRSQMGWPQHLRPISDTFWDDTVAAEWPIGWDGDPDQNKQRVRREMKLNPGETVWVLSTIGPAVQGKVKEITLRQTNECSGAEAWVAVLEVKLPEGASPALMSTQDPPASWMQTPPPPAIPYESAKRAMLTKIQELDPNFQDTDWHQLWPDGGTWRGEYFEPLTEERPEWGESWNGFHRHHVLRTDASGRVTVSSDAVHSNDVEEPSVLITGELAGTGVEVQVVADSCQSAVRTLEGYNLLSSTYRCCGC